MKQSFIAEVTKLALRGQQSGQPLVEPRGGVVFGVDAALGRNGNGAEVMRLKPHLREFRAPR